MKSVGQHHIASTRNNAPRELFFEVFRVPNRPRFHVFFSVLVTEDFTNRSHKATITVTGFAFEVYENIALGVGACSPFPSDFGTFLRSTEGNHELFHRFFPILLRPLTSLKPA